MQVRPGLPLEDMPVRRPLRRSTTLGEPKIPRVYSPRLHRNAEPRSPAAPNAHATTRAPAATSDRRRHFSRASGCPSEETAKLRGSECCSQKTGPGPTSPVRPLGEAVRSLGHWGAAIRWPSTAPTNSAFNRNFGGSSSPRVAAQVRTHVCITLNSPAPPHPHSPATNKPPHRINRPPYAAFPRVGLLAFVGQPIHEFPRRPCGAEYSSTSLTLWLCGEAPLLLPSRSARPGV
jgi:hypothetical protein